MQQDKINWDDIRQEATDYLCSYLQIDTINPPGNETEGARFLQGLLEKEGIDAEIIESEPGRGNIVARLNGNGSGKPLVLLSHLDVVPAEAAKWDHAPLSGAIVEDEIWGRGALDCKSLGIMETMVLILLKRTGQALGRDVVLLAVADEEKGGTKGAAWLAENRPDLFDVDAVINEGGGVGVTRTDSNYYLCQVAEKGICWFRIYFSGNPGHASIPRDDNCLFSLGRCLEIIGNYRSRIQMPPVMGKFVETFSGDKEIAFLLEKMANVPEQADEVLEGIPDTGLRQILGTMIRNTFVPTVAKGGEKN